MKLLVQVLSDGSLGPADADSEEWFAKRTPGDSFYADIKRARNPEFHRYTMAVLQFAVENTEWKSVETLLIALKYETGLIEEITSDRTGAVYYKPMSIAFANMGQDTYANWWPEALDALERLTGIDAQTLSEASRARL